MHRNISFNQEICLSAEAVLPAVSPSSLYGCGVFTTLAIYQSKPFLWQKHWQRLTENASKLNIDLDGFSENSVHQTLMRLIVENAVIKGRARITFFDASDKGLWKSPSNLKTNLLISTGEPHSKSDFNLTISPCPVNSKSPLANIKSCNYLENLLVINEAKERGFNEAIRVNEKGEITSAAMANIFWCKDEKLLTPSLKTGCLAGTTREFLLENFAVSEVELPLEYIKNADEIFLTSSGIGIGKVKNLEGKLLKSTKFSDKINLKLQQITNPKRK